MFNYITNAIHISILSVEFDKSCQNIPDLKAFLFFPGYFPKVTNKKSNEWSRRS